MPKSRHRSYHKYRVKRRYEAEVSPRRDDREVRSTDRSSTNSRGTSRNELSQTLKEILAFMRNQRDTGGQIQTSLVNDSEEPLTLESHDAHSSLGGQSVSPPPEVTFQADKQTVLENRGGEPEPQLLSQATFDEAGFNKENEFSLTSQFFGNEQPSESIASWDQVIFNVTKSEVRSGLKEEVRSSLLLKYELKGELASLGPPKINRELIAALAKRQSVLKRDDYQLKEQQQVGACLNALGSGISDLIKTHQEGVPLDEETKAAISKLAEGIHLLADHQHRLSLARQAFIKPCLTFVGKSAADGSTVDEWLFGTSFAEVLKSAQACEKAGRELSKPTVSSTAAGKSTLQPVRQNPAQQAPVRRAGNARAPANRVSTQARQSGASYRASRSHYHSTRSHARARSRSRIRR